jgi:hypothetical protein
VHDVGAAAVEAFCGNAERFLGLVDLAADAAFFGEGFDLGCGDWTVFEFFRWRSGSPRSSPSVRLASPFLSLGRARLGWIFASHSSLLGRCGGKRWLTACGSGRSVC